jgi:3-hydroxy-3-methylglutaryl CoA synthase
MVRQKKKKNGSKFRPEKLKIGKKNYNMGKKNQKQTNKIKLRPKTRYGFYKFFFKNRKRVMIQQKNQEKTKKNLICNGFV